MPNSKAASPEPEDTPPLVAVEPVPGKGRGVVALQAITKGERLIAEAPIISIRQSCTYVTFRASVDRQIKAFTEEQKVWFLSLENRRKECSDLVGKILSNSLPSRQLPPFGPDDYEAGLFMTACLINHACDANSNYAWNESLDKLTVHAVRDIAKGEEITISYLNARRATHFRKADLKRDFDFDCTCRICSYEPVRRFVSDCHFESMRQLEKILARPLGMDSPHAHLQAAQQLISNFLFEGIHDINASRVYYSAFQAAVAFSDLARARVFAERAAQWRALICGEDHPMVQTFKDWAKNPKTHHLCGCSKLWETKAEDVPEGLDEQGFEKWLWRM